VTFTKRLREGERRGEITCSVRFWMRPHVRVGARYRMEEGEIEVDSIEPIGFPDITPALARESGFLGVLDLLKVTKHGRGENIYLVRFHFVPPRRKRTRKSTQGNRRVDQERHSPRVVRRAHCPLHRNRAISSLPRGKRNVERG